MKRLRIEDSFSHSWVCFELIVKEGEERIHETGDAVILRVSDNLHVVRYHQNL